MRTTRFIYALTMLLCMVSIKAKAYYFSAENEDGVIIYYNNTTDSNSPLRTVEVTYKDAPTRDSGSGLYIYYPSYSGDVVIPSTVTTKTGIQYTVTSIGNSAFRNCDKLTSIILPEIVTSIEQGAFC